MKMKTCKNQLSAERLKSSEILSATVLISKLKIPLVMFKFKPSNERKLLLKNTSRNAEKSFHHLSSVSTGKRRFYRFDFSVLIRTSSDELLADDLRSLRAVLQAQIQGRSKDTKRFQQLLEQNRLAFLEAIQLLQK